MKTILFLLGLLPAFTGFAQQYSIDWFKISGGGGASTNSVSCLQWGHRASNPMRSAGNSR